MSKYKKHKKLKKLKDNHYRFLRLSPMEIEKHIHPSYDGPLPDTAPAPEMADDGDWVPLMKFKVDKDAMRHRLEKGIPHLLAMVLPPEMEISVADICCDEPVYIVPQIPICGTAEDIIEYLATQQKSTV